ncbi:hypothetical protein FAIPA1_190079 [Frankia sp. AiPs1]
MSTTLFRDVLVYDAGAPGRLTGPTDLLVDGNRIVSIGDRDASIGDRGDRGAVDDRGAFGDRGARDRHGRDRVIEGGGHHLVIPGLVNAHFHSPANHLKGDLPSLPLELFMLFETPADTPRPSPREAYLRTMLGALEMLRTGTTSVQDDAFLLPAPDPEIIDAVLSAYAHCGIRAACWSTRCRPRRSRGMRTGRPTTSSRCSPTPRSPPTRTGPSSRPRPRGWRTCGRSTRSSWSPRSSGTRSPPPRPPSTAGA